MLLNEEYNVVGATSNEGLLVWMIAPSSQIKQEDM